MDLLGDQTVRPIPCNKENVVLVSMYVKDHVFRGHQDAVDQLVWHKTNADLLATASGDRTVRIWDSRASKCQANIPTKGENINIAWHPDGNLIAVGSKEDVISFVDTRKMKVVKDCPFRFEVNELTWNNAGTLFYLTSGNGTVNIFRLEWPVRSISFSFDGALLASGSEDHVIDISDTRSGERVADLPVDAAIFTIAWHPKKLLLAFACEDKEAPRGPRETGQLKLFGFPN
ncbi:unnamed protein product [Cyprideis torosa]|uniref:Uncharacterized protein n=1 Tax=Cyprideis torosa TaxID=163714 RepID=A0A7R8WIU2_9CRUS|nr:unnamed protein product [Cyprideis torosa]CAG0894488.1 unnamed protein product [Cyprideis torosa]